jgi:trimeric autotransporter adhesin
MSAQGLLAKLGLRTDVLGSFASLAIAAPLATGNGDPAAATSGSRIGWYFDRTVGLEKIGTVVMGVEALSISPTGITTINLNVTGSFTLPNQNANLVFAGPATGAPATPTFRSLVLADLPAGSITGSLAATQVAFGSGTNQITGSANLTFDGTNLVAAGSITASNAVGAVLIRGDAVGTLIVGNGNTVTGASTQGPIVLGSTNTAFQTTSRQVLVGYGNNAASAANLNVIMVGIGNTLPATASNAIVLSSGFTTATAINDSVIIGLPGATVGATSVLIGRSAQAGVNSVAVGNTAVGSGASSVAIGQGTTASAINSIAVGQGVSNAVTNTAVWGNTSITDHTFSGTIHLLGLTSGSAGIKAAAVAGTPATLTLPTTNGSSGSVLTTDGAGLLSWSTGTGITGTITNTQVAFGAATPNTIQGSANLTYNGTTLTTASNIVNSKNGAASVSAELLSGTWFTGGSATTTKPQLLIEPTGTTSTGWNTAGTGLGVNAATGFTGNLLDLQLNGVSSASVKSDGSFSALNIQTLANSKAILGTVDPGSPNQTNTVVLATTTGNQAGGTFTIVLGNGGLVSTNLMSQSVLMGRDTNVTSTSATHADNYTLGYFINVTDKDATWTFGGGVSTGSRLAPHASNTINFGLNSTVPSLWISAGTGIGTFGSVNVDGRSLNIGTVPYVWPSAQGAANTVLVDDGAGNLSWAAVSTVGIGGTIAAPQIAFGSGANTIAGDANFVYTGTQVGLGTSTPAAKLDIVGTDLATAADLSVANIFTHSTLTKNTNTTRTFYGTLFKPTFNTGGANTTTTYNVFAIDSVNTSLTGLTVNLLNLSFGGTNVLLLDSSGKLTLPRNGTGAGDFTLGLTGTPVASATSSQVRIGSAITTGNAAANGGTYFGINGAAAGAGSAADIMLLQANSLDLLRVQANRFMRINGATDDTGNPPAALSIASTVAGQNYTLYLDNTSDTGGNGALVIRTQGLTGAAKAICIRNTNHPTNFSWFLGSLGAMAWGSGDAARDVQFSRTATTTGTLQIDNNGVGSTGGDLLIFGKLLVRANGGGTTVDANAALTVNGQVLNTNADQAISVMSTLGSVTKNDSNTRQFYGSQFKPTFNTGASNLNTTYNVINVDTVNTSVTGLTVNLMSLSYGGTSAMLVEGTTRFTRFNGAGNDPIGNAQVSIASSGTSNAPALYVDGSADTAGAAVIIAKVSNTGGGSKAFAIRNASHTSAFSFTILSLGAMSWGTGDAGRDVGLSRSGAGILQIDNTLGGAGSLAVTSQVAVGSTALDTTAALKVVGANLSTAADQAVSMEVSTGSVTKNDANTRTFFGALWTPTFNTGGANTTTTYNVLAVDTVNTSLTGLTVNLLKLSFGGVAKFNVTSAGDVSVLKGVAYSWPSVQGAASTVLTNDGAGNLTWAAGGGGGTIGGSIAANQIAYGLGVNTIQGSANLTYDGTRAVLAGTVATGSLLAVNATTSGTLNGMSLTLANSGGTSITGISVAFVSATSAATLIGLDMSTNNGSSPTTVYGIRFIPAGSLGSLTTAYFLFSQNRLFANYWQGATTIEHDQGASDPQVRVQGTWFVSGGSSTTTKPQLLVEPLAATSTGWSTNGTGLGVNSAAGFTGNLIDLQLNGVSKFSVASTGNTVIAGTANITGATTVTSTSLNIGTVTYVWPGAQGAANSYLKNDGAGNLSWVTLAAVTGAGTLNQVAIWSSGTAITGTTHFFVDNDGSNYSQVTFYDPSFTESLISVANTSSQFKGFCMRNSDQTKRWQIFADGSEGGGNSGSSLCIRRYTDAGALIDQPLKITRNSNTATWTGVKNIFPASVVGLASINIPHGTAPTAPVNGDIWTTATAMFVQINGATVQLGSGTIGGSIASTQIAFGDVTANTIQGNANFTAAVSNGALLVNIAQTTTDTNGVDLITSTLTVNPGSASVQTYDAGFFKTTNTNAGAANLTNGTLRGVRAQALAQSLATNTIGTVIGLEADVNGFCSGSSTLTITTMRGIYVNPILQTSGGSGAVTVTTYAGIYLETLSATGGGTFTITNRYGVYQADTAAKNFFAGIVGVGNQAPSASTALATPASTTTVSSLRAPHGTAPTAPVDGDIWTTTVAMFVRINGVTVQLGSGGGTIGGSITQGQVAFGAVTSNQIAGSGNFTWSNSTNSLLIQAPGFTASSGIARINGTFTGSAGNHYMSGLTISLDNAQTGGSNNAIDGLLTNVSCTGSGTTNNSVNGIRTIVSLPTGQDTNQTTLFNGSMTTSSGSTYSTVYGSNLTCSIDGTISNFVGHELAATLIGAISTAAVSYSDNLNTSGGGITLPAFRGFSSTAVVASTDTVTDLVSFYTVAQLSGTATNFYGAYLSPNVTGSGVATNLYGIYIAPQNTGAVTNLFGIYQAGANVLNQFEGPILSSLSPIASQVAGLFNGVWFSGGDSTTTKPMVLIETSGTPSSNWNTSGTAFGVNANISFGGNLVDLQVNGNSYLRVDFLGTAIVSGLADARVGDVSSSWNDGGSQVLQDNSWTIINVNTSTISSFTLFMPANVIDGKMCVIATSGEVTSFTLDGNGHTINDAPSTLLANTSVAFEFLGGIWFRLY